MLLTPCVEPENSSNNNATNCTFIGRCTIFNVWTPCVEPEIVSKGHETMHFAKEGAIFDVVEISCGARRLKIENCVLIGHHSPCCDHLVPTEPNAEWWLANKRGPQNQKQWREKNKHFLITTLVEKNQKSIAPDVWLTVALRPQQ